MVTQTPGGSKYTALEIVGVAAAIAATIAAIAATIVAFYSWRTSEEGLDLTKEQTAISTATIKSPNALADPNNCTYRTTVDGFRLSGEATMLHGDALWVLLSPIGSPSFYIMSDHLVTKSSGPWSIDVSDIGDPKDEPGSEYTFLILSADPGGSAEILRAYQEGDGKLKQIPNNVRVMTTGCAKHI
jgi:hypothetical protein